MNFDDEDDEGGMFGMFGDDDNEQEEEKVVAAEEVKKEDLPVKDPNCPLEGDPKNTRVLVRYENAEGEITHLPATIRSYESPSNTYTIIWLESGIMQYRTAPTDIDWVSKVEYVEKEQKRVEFKDELWIAAKRGDLSAVQKFILEEGVDKNETGPDQQRTPFYHAVFCGHAKVVEFLISQGCWDEDNTAFITANAEIREILLKTNTRRKSSAVAPPLPPMPSSATTTEAAAPAAVQQQDKKPAATMSSEAEERKSRRKSKRTSVTFVDEVEEVVMKKSITDESKFALVASKKKSASRLVRLVSSMLSVFGRKPQRA